MPVKCFYWNISFFSYVETEKENIYMLVSCAICGGFQSMETYVSTSQVVQFGFSDGCNWSPILWHFCTRELLQVKQAPYVKRVFSPPPNPAASQSYRQLVHRALLPSCPQIPGVTLTAWCLLQVTAEALAFSGTLADRGKPFTPKDSIWLFWCGFFGILCSSKNPTTYQLTAMCRLENYKCTDRQSCV